VDYSAAGFRFSRDLAIGGSPDEAASSDPAIASQMQIWEGRSAWWHRPGIEAAYPRNYLATTPPGIAADRAAL
jgi:hypothetical protein